MRRLEVDREREAGGLIDRDVRISAGNFEAMLKAYRLARQDANPCEIVLDLLDRGQHRLAIGRDVRLVGFTGRLDLGPREAAASFNRLQSCERKASDKSKPAFLILR